jgi:hypothetical protein
MASLAPCKFFVLLEMGRQCIANHGNCGADLSSLLLNAVLFREARRGALDRMQPRSWLTLIGKWPANGLRFALQ